MPNVQLRTTFNPKPVEIEEGKKYADYTMLLLGGVGSGKTTMALTAERPIYVMDVDNKLHLMAGIVDMSGVQYQQFPSNKKGRRKASIIVSPNPVKPGEGFVPSHPNVWQDLIDTVESLHELYAREGKLPFRTLVLDTISRASEHLKEAILELLGYTAMTQRAWGDYYENRLRLIRDLTELPCNLVICCHDTIFQDDLTKEIVVQPAIPGKMATQIGGFLGEVYYMLPKIAKERMTVDVLTRSDSKYRLRSTMTDLVKVPADIERIVRGDFRGEKGKAFAEMLKMQLQANKGGKVIAATIPAVSPNSTNSSQNSSVGQGLSEEEE